MKVPSMESGHRGKVEYVVAIDLSRRPRSAAAGSKRLPDHPENTVERCLPDGALEVVSDFSQFAPGMTNSKQCFSNTHCK